MCYIYYQDDFCVHKNTLGPSTSSVPSASSSDEESIFPSKEEMRRRKLRHEKGEFIKVSATV